MNVSLTREFDRFIDAQVNSGEYQSASEVVRHALRLLKQENAVRKAALRDVRRKIASGLRQLRRGEIYDGESVFAELEKRGRKRRRARK